MLKITSLCLVLLALVVLVSAQNLRNNVNRAPPPEPPPSLDDEAAIERELCRGKGNQWFRLTSGTGDNKEDCRSVIQCTDSGLQAIKCPAGLAFDIEGQTCNWKDAVDNCAQVQKIIKIKPNLATDEPVCEATSHLACGDGTCIEKTSFCNGVNDCKDGSDENACTMDEDPNSAEPCDPVQCQLPKCFCSPTGQAIPGNLSAAQTPQMVMITFDDAVTINNIDVYQELFSPDRLNPNGCTIKGTFFVSHRYTNYSAVQELSRDGHEIAAHSVTHNDSEAHWKNASTDDWAKEMHGTRLMIEKFANIPRSEVNGMRAPLLRVGGNYQFDMAANQLFVYDSTITAPLTNPPLWPYTLAYRMPHACHGDKQKCPTRPAAVWEMVMNEMDRRENPETDEETLGCAMIDSCSNIIDAKQFYDFLTYNFKRHYEQNRAPMGLFFHAAWLKNRPDFFDTLQVFIDEILEEMDDVYFVTMSDVIQWIQNPTIVNLMPQFAPWKERCQPLPKNDNRWCPTVNSCMLRSKELPDEKNLVMQTCNRCPPNYPWVNDPTGAGFF